MASDVQFELTQQPDFALLNVQLDDGQKIFAEPSAMASIVEPIGVSTTRRASFIGMLPFKIRATSRKARRMVVTPITIEHSETSP